MLDSLSAILFSTFLSSRPTRAFCSSKHSAVHVLIRSFYSPSQRCTKLEKLRRRGKDERDWGCCQRAMTRDGHGRCQTSVAVDARFNQREVKRSRSPFHFLNSCRTRLHRDKSTESILQRTSFRTSPCHLMFTRCVASTASMPHRQQRVMFEPSVALESLQSDLLKASSDDDSTLNVQLWDAFVALKDSGQISQLSMDELLNLTRRITSATRSALFNNARDAHLVQHWEVRLTALLEEIESRGEDFLTIREGSCIVKSYQAQVRALQGKFDESLQTLAQLHDKHDSDKEGVPYILEAHKIYFLASLHLRSAEDTLDAVAEHIPKLTAILSLANDSKVVHPLSQVGGFHEIFFRALREMDSPVSYFNARVDQWSEDQVVNIGLAALRLMTSAGLAKDAEQLLSLLRRISTEIKSNPKVTLSVVMALSKSRRTGQAKTMYLSLPTTWKDAREQRLYDRTGLLLSSRHGDTDRAEELFRKISASREHVEDRDISALMHAYAVCGDAKRVEEIFEEYFGAGKKDNDTRSPNIRHFTAILLAHSKRNDLDTMHRWIGTMIDCGCTPDLTIHNILLRTLAMRDDITSMFELLQRMRQLDIRPDVQSYTTIIKLLGQRRDPRGAEGLFKRMLHEGVKPDRLVVTALMNAHVEAGSWKGVIRVFDYLRKIKMHDLYVDTEVMNTLLKAYVLMGAPVEIVLDIFDRMDASCLQPTPHTFSLLIQSACDADRLDIAYRVLHELEYRASYWESGLEVTVYALTIIMAAHLRAGDKESAKSVYKDMQVRGIKPTSVTFGAILKAYANEKSADSIHIAESFLKTLVTPTDERQRMWTQSLGGRMSAMDQMFAPVMDAYAKAQSPADVERLYEDIQQAGGKPSLSTLTIMLDSYRRTGHIEGVLRLWPQIVQLGMEFSESDMLLEDQDKDAASYQNQRRSGALCVSLSIYIDAVSSAGEHIEVARAWNNLRNEGFQFDGSNWNHLAVAMVLAGHPERAFEVIERVVLPYHEYVEPSDRSDEDELNEGPRLFDTQEDGNQGSGMPLHTAHRNPERRAAAASAFATVDIESVREDARTKEDDYAFALHVLHTSTPTSNLWRVHARTLIALSDALHCLQSRRLVRPTRKADSPDDDDGYGDIPSSNGIPTPDESLAAAAMLQRIYRDCPRTVRLIETWDRSERRHILAK